MMLSYKLKETNILHEELGDVFTQQHFTTYAPGFSKID